MSPIVGSRASRLPERDTKGIVSFVPPRSLWGIPVVSVVFWHPSPQPCNLKSGFARKNEICAVFECQIPIGGHRTSLRSRSDGVKIQPRKIVRPKTIHFWKLLAKSNFRLHGSSLTPHLPVTRTRSATRGGGEQPTPSQRYPMMSARQSSSWPRCESLRYSRAATAILCASQYSSRKPLLFTSRIRRTSLQ